MEGEKVQDQYVELVESEVEPENHPLKNDVILREVLGYLDTGTNDSFRNLKTLRGVCRKWKEVVTPRLMTRSRICLARAGLQGYYFHQRGANQNLKCLNSLMTQTHKTSLAIIHQRASKCKRCRIKTKELWNSSNNWIKSNGDKFRTLTLNGQFCEDVLTSLLHEWIPNLEDLTMNSVVFSKNSTANAYKLVDKKDSSANWKSLEKLKSVAIRIGRFYHRGGTPGKVDEVVEVALKVLAQAKNVKSLTICPKENLALRFLTQTLKEDTPMFKDLNKLELELNQYEYAPLTPILAQVELPNLRELIIPIKVNESLEHVLKSHGQKLEKLTVGFKACWINENYIFTNPDLAKLSNLQQYTLLFDDNGGFFGAEGNDNIIIMLKANSVIQSMPRLKSWIVKNSRGRCTWWPNVDDVTARIIFKTESGQSLPVHTALETLDFGPCFTEPETLALLINAFVNIRDLTIWINSNELNGFIDHLTSLTRLTRLRILLTKFVRDFPTAVLQMENFQNLKEFTLDRRSSYHSQQPNIDNFFESHSGLAKCQTLEILSFYNIKVFPDQLEALRRELSRSNPKLVVNHHYNH